MTANRRHASGILAARAGYVLTFGLILLSWAAIESRASSSQVAVDAPALTPVNDVLPPWLSLGGSFRFRFEGRQGLGFVDGNEDAYGLVRTRLDIDVTPANWLGVFIQAQDSRAPGIRPAAANGVFRDPVDLRQAWVRFGSSETGPLTLTVGRQLLLFGDQRLVGPLDWTNTARTWDAVRLGIEPADGVRFDVFTSSVVANDPGLQLNRSPEGNNLHGVYGALDQLIPNGTVEPFLLWRTSPSVAGETGAAGDMDRYSAGTRVLGSVDRTDYSATFVRQWGSFASSDISAWAYSVNVGHTLGVPTTPRIYVEYNFASGDEDPLDGKIGWFDDVYPTAHLYYGYNDLVGWRNIKNLRTGASFQLIPRLRAAVDVHSFWLANTADDLYNVAGRTTLASSGSGPGRVGDEIDVTFTAPVTSTTTIGGGVGHFIPGAFVEASSPGASNTFTYFFANHNF